MAYDVDSITWCGLEESGCDMCELEPDALCLDPCTAYGEARTYACAAIPIYYEGDPVFFPIDDHPEAVTPSSKYTGATIPPAYGLDWDPDPTGEAHNFHFISEIRVWFRYDASQTYGLEIVGDDDVWAFVNDWQAIDLGGVHTPVAGAATIDSSNAADYELEDGGVYEVAVFQAERQTDTSTFRLSLTGFVGGPSVCGPLP